MTHLRNFLGDKGPRVEHWALHMTTVWLKKKFETVEIATKTAHEYTR